MMNVIRRLFLIAMVVACTGAQAEGRVVAREVIPFSGILDLGASKVQLTLLGQETGAVILDMSRPVGGRYDLKVDIRHVSTPLGDVAAVVTGRFDLVGPDPSHKELLGEVSTRYALLNYKPVRDAYVKFAVRNRRLTVDPLWFGALSGHGEIGLMDRYDMNVSLDLLSADLDEFWVMLGGSGMKTPPVSGIITGSLLLQGPWAKPMVSGHLAAYNGRFKSFGYEMIDLRFDGAYPLIHFQDGKVVSSGGPGFKITGALDLSDLARFEAQARQLKREFIVSDNDSGRTWAFKLDPSDGHATRLKAFISGDADGRKQGEPVIGLEKHIGF